MAKDKPPKDKPSKHRSSATFAPGNPHRFTAGGESPSPGGKQSKYRLLSKAIRERLAARAPDSVCESCKLPQRSSWAQVLGTQVVNAAIRGDMGAARLVADLSGDAVRAQLAIGFDPDDEDGGNSGPLLEVVFTSTKYKSLAEGHKVTDSTATVVEDTLQLDGSRGPMLLEGKLPEPDPFPAPESVAPAPAKPKGTRFSNFAPRTSRPAPQPPGKITTDASLGKHMFLDAAKKWPVPEHIRRQYEAEQAALAAKKR